MKYYTTSNFLTRSGLAVALAMTLAAGSSAFAQSTAPAKSTTAAKDSMMTSGTMAERHQAMQAQREKMMAEHKTQDTELQAQLAKIKSAPQAQKLDLLTAVVTRMVEQRTAMHAHMDKMMNQMMATMPMEPGSMSSHPMMKGMDDKPAGPTKKQN